jgi:hypothetical protein
MATSPSTIASKLSKGQKTVIRTRRGRTIAGATRTISSLIKKRLATYGKREKNATLRAYGVTASAKLTDLGMRVWAELRKVRVQKGRKAWKAHKAKRTATKPKPRTRARSTTRTTTTRRPQSNVRPPYSQATIDSAADIEGESLTDYLDKLESHYANAP